MDSHDLAEEILALPPYEVFVASDAEGNKIRPLAEYGIDYLVRDGNEFEATDEDFSDDAFKAIVIWPV